GKGHVAIKLTGSIGKDSQEFVYEVNFPEKTNDERAFVEDLWARRKVGYLLDQIRANGEKKELVDEVVLLAKRYGITTPYTSSLGGPEAPIPVAGGLPGRPGMDAPPVALRPAGAGGPALRVKDLAEKLQGKGKEAAAEYRGRFE